MAKTEVISVRVSWLIKKGVETAAKENRRSSASLVEKIVTEWLASRGYLKSEK